MSQFITEAFVTQFADNIYMLSQQKGSRLRPYVRHETQAAKAKGYDRIGAVDVVEKTGRHSNTPQLDTPHSRRWCFLKDYEWSDLIDDQDKIRILNEPTSEYVMAAMWSMGRKMDRVIIDAASAVIKTGEDIGSGADAPLPNSQRLAASDGTAFSNLNSKTLIAIKSKFGVNDIDDSIRLHIAVNQRQIDGLLADDKVTSGDYNTIKALVRGEVNEYMGFTFHRTNQVGVSADGLSASVSTGVVGTGSSTDGFRKTVAWAEDGLILAVGKDMVSRISERADKSYATQPYACMSIGATRMEEEKVVVTYCKEA
jgi:hypothetical protein